MDETGKILREQKLPTTPAEMKQTFGRMARCRIAMETGTHSPWVSRLLTALGHEVIVAHAQRVRLIVKSRLKEGFLGLPLPEGSPNDPLHMLTALRLRLTGSVEIGQESSI